MFYVLILHSVIFTIGHDLPWLWFRIMQVNIQPVAKLCGGSLMADQVDRTSRPITVDFIYMCVCLTSGNLTSATERTCPSYSRFPDINHQSTKAGLRQRDRAMANEGYTDNEALAGKTANSLPTLSSLRLVATSTSSTSCTSSPSFTSTDIATQTAISQFTFIELHDTEKVFPLREEHFLRSEFENICETNDCQTDCFNMTRAFTASERALGHSIDGHEQDMALTITTIARVDEILQILFQTEYCGNSSAMVVCQEWTGSNPMQYLSDFYNQNSVITIHTAPAFRALVTFVLLILQGLSLCRFLDNGASLFLAAHLSWRLDRRRGAPSSMELLSAHLKFGSF